MVWSFFPFFWLPIHSPPCPETFSVLFGKARRTGFAALGFLNIALSYNHKFTALRQTFAFHGVDVHSIGQISEVNHFLSLHARQLHAFHLHSQCVGEPVLAVLGWKRFSSKQKLDTPSA